MNIDNIMDNITDFYSWLYSQAGLSKGQLLIIALAVLFLLVSLLRYLQKIRLRKMYFPQRSDRGEIIGIKLSGNNARETDNLRQEDYKKYRAADISEEEQEHTSWGQTTKEWRKLKEKIMYLKHEISKHERSAKHLKEQITELKNINNKLQLEINRQRQITPEELKKQDNVRSPLVSTDVYDEQKETAENLMVTTQQSTENNVNSLEEIPKDNSENTDTELLEDERSIPLDIKELKAISELAKRLQSRSQQRENE